MTGRTDIQRRNRPPDSIPSGCAVQATMLATFLFIFYLSALAISILAERPSSEIIPSAVESEQSLSTESAVSIAHSADVVPGSD